MDAIFVDFALANPFTMEVAEVGFLNAAEAAKRTFGWPPFSFEQLSGETDEVSLVVRGCGQRGKHDVLGIEMEHPRRSARSWLRCHFEGGLRLIQKIARSW